MSDSTAQVPRVLAIDAGGTMTDTFIVDQHGSFAESGLVEANQNGRAQPLIARIGRRTYRAAA